MARMSVTQWMGTNAIYFSSPGIPDTALLDYMEKNKIGCWIYDGNLATLATFKADCSSMFATIQNNYTIPIGLNLNAISENWSWGAYTPAQYDAMGGASLKWAIETYPCITMLWYENGFPNFGSWLYGAASGQSSMAWKGAQAYGVKVGMGIYNYWGSQNATSDPLAPTCRGGWLCGADGSVPLSTRFAQCNFVTPEFWYQTDVAIMLNLIQYLQAKYPALPIYWDSQCQGGQVGNGNVWGATDTSASPGNYATIRSIFKTQMTQIAKTIGGFNGALMEFNGDSDGSVTGGTEDQIIESQFDYMIGCNLQKGVSTTTQLLASKSGTSNTAFADAQVATTLTCVSPANGTIGTAVNITGKLTRNDTGAGVAGQTIQLQINSTDVSGKTATTATDGTYTISYTETVIRTDAFDVTFTGATV